MRNKKGETAENVIMMMLLVCLMFAGMFLFWSNNTSQAGQTIPAEYNATYQNITIRQTQLQTTTNNVRDAISDIEEDPNVITGIKGFFKSLLLIKDSITTGLSIFFDLAAPMSILPGYVISFIIGALIVIVVFALLRAIGGRWNI